MVDPKLAFAVASSVFSAVGAIQQGQSQAAFSDYNAQVAERDAEAARQAGEFEADKHQKEVRRMLSAQAAAFGASGVDGGTGSPLLVMAETAAEGKLDELAIRYSASVQEARLRSQAAGDRLAGRAARRGGFLRAGEHLLAGGAAIGGELGIPGGGAPAGNLTIRTPTATI